MHLAGAIALLLGGFTVITLVLAWPFLQAGLRATEARPTPWWALVPGGVAVVVAALALGLDGGGAPEVFVALGLAALMVAGIFSKWVLEIIACKPVSLHEGSLVQSLLLAPLAIVLLGPAVFPASLRPAVLLLWFANGFIWQTVTADIARIRLPERPIIRRREP